MSTPAPRLASGVFRDEQARIHDRLARLEAVTSSLSSLSLEEAGVAMQEMVRSLEEEVVPHTAWEEAHLYSLCDGLAGNNLDRFTAVLRHQHRLLEGSIQTLARMVDRGAPVAEFIRQMDRLLGLLAGHLDSEETVLLGVVDRWFTAEQLEVLLARPDAS
jgi:hemerythrin-like domain-containing protein